MKLEKENFSPSLPVVSSFIKKEERGGFPFYQPILFITIVLCWVQIKLLLLLFRKNNFVPFCD